MKLLLLTPLLLTACMQLTPDQGMTPVTVAQPLAVKQDVNAHEYFPNKPFTLDVAVEVALRNNKTLQAAFNELGITESLLVQATLPPSPILSLSRIGNNAVVEVEKSLLFNLLSILTLNQHVDIAETKLRAAQLKTIEEVLRLTAETRRNYIAAIAAQKQVLYLEQAHNSAKITSKLFKRLGEAGAVNKLDQAREHVFTAEIAGKLAAARLNAKDDKEKLIRTLGIWDNAHKLRLPTDFPTVKPQLTLHHLEQDALARRVDLAMLKLDLDVAAKQAGLAQSTQYLNLFELRTRDIHENDLVGSSKTSRSGMEIELQIPLFDLGAAKSQEAKERYLKALNLFYAKAITIRSEAREAHARYKGTYELMRHYQNHILPLRKTIQDEQMLRYNAMLIDILPVLAENRQRISSNIEAINATRDYHLAHSELKTVVIGGGVSNAPTASTATAKSTEGGH